MFAAVLQPEIVVELPEVTEKLAAVPEIATLSESLTVIVQTAY